ncbi:MAG TPA: acyltransferase family protein [Streptosporangiaceae bacterium]|nr:acyltransferase family protein [Streptosporangiaceae bacterium]
MTTQAVNGTTSNQTATRLPGLDGLRALAVIAVIAFHEQLSPFPGGFLGVDVFFVLSGYLITDLLVAQWNRHGHLTLRGFWARRARRLLPALGVLLVAVTAATAVIEPAQMTALRDALLAAVTYSSNWWQALAHHSYFAQFGPPPPLQHLWSLAIEEQFYLLWPLLLIGILRTCQSGRIRAALAWLGAALSALAMVLVYVPGADPSRVYYGTDTHASALFIGSALALTWPLRRMQAMSRDGGRVPDAIGLAGIAVLAWAMGHFAGTDRVLYPAGLLIVALAAGGVVLAAASPGLVSWALGGSLLRWIGIRSYGIYLWHWPVIALADAAFPRQLPAHWIWLPEVALSVGLAAASWRWVEEPIIRNGFRVTVRGWSRVIIGSPAGAHRAPARVVPAVAVVAALVVAGAAGYGVLHAHAATGLAEQISQGVKVSQQDPAGPGAPGPAAAPGPSALTPSASTPAATAPAAGTPSASAPAAGTASARPSATPATAIRAAVAPAPAAARVSGSKVFAIGDSVMLASAVQVAAALPGISIDAQVSRQVSAGLPIVQRLAAAGTLRPVVVFALGTNGAFTTQQMRQLIRAVGPHRDLVLVNTYEARPWEAGVNGVIAAAARRYPNVVMANWFAAIEHRTRLLWPDEVHPQPSGARLYARMIAAAVRAARTAGAAGPVSGSGLPPTAHHIAPLG